MKKTRRQEGFTLIEMVVVIAIIVVLILIIAPNLIQQKGKAENRTNDAFKTTLQTQAELYEGEYDKKADSFEELRDKGYLTERQMAKSKNYSISDGEVSAKN